MNTYHLKIRINWLIYRVRMKLRAWAQRIRRAKRAIIPEAKGRMVIKRAFVPYKVTRPTWYIRKPKPKPGGLRYEQITARRKRRQPAIRSRYRKNQEPRFYLQGGEKHVSKRQKSGMLA